MEYKTIISRGAAYIIHTRARRTTTQVITIPTQAITTRIHTPTLFTISHIGVDTVKAATEVMITMGAMEAANMDTVDTAAAHGKTLVL